MHAVFAQFTELERARGLDYFMRMAREGHLGGVMTDRGEVQFTLDPVGACHLARLGIPVGPIPPILKGIAFPDAVNIALLGLGLPPSPEGEFRDDVRRRLPPGDRAAFDARYVVALDYCGDLETAAPRPCQVRTTWREVAEDMGLAEAFDAETARLAALEARDG